jgi:hypothetical protein
MLMSTAAKTLARIDGLIRLRQGKHLDSIGLPTERNKKRECVGSSLCNRIPRNNVLNLDNNVHTGRVWSLRKARAGRSDYGKCGQECGHAAETHQGAGRESHNPLVWLGTRLQAAG